MRVRVSYQVTVTDEYRRALRRRIGRKGMATRAEVIAWHIRYGDSADTALMDEHGDEATAKAEAEEREAAEAAEGKPRRRGGFLRKVQEGTE